MFLQEKFFQNYCIPKWDLSIKNHAETNLLFIEVFGQSSKNVKNEIVQFFCKIATRGTGVVTK